MKMYRHSAGFSLIELLIVMSIIMILAALAVPNLMEAQQRAYEAAAVGMLRSLHTNQEQYRISNDQYANQFALITEFGLALGGGALPSAPPGKGAGAGRGRGRAGGGADDVLVYSNFIFRLKRPAPDQWNCSAEPVRARSVAKYFYVDQTGVIRYQLGSPANATSPSL